MSSTSSASSSAILPEIQADGCSNLHEAIVDGQLPKRSLNYLLGEIEKIASWEPIDTNRQQLDLMLSECRDNYPGQEGELEKRLQRGRQARELLGPFYKLSNQYGKNSAEVKKALADLKKAGRHDLIWKAKQQIDKGNIAYERRSEASQRKNNGQPLSSVQIQSGQANSSIAPLATPTPHNFQSVNFSAIHPLDIRGLEPADDWTLLIDETGDKFDQSADLLKSGDLKLGRFAGLLLANNHKLAPLPAGWHAVDKSITEIDSAIQAILDARVGAIGLTVQQLPQTPMERWTFGVMQLIDLVLRLLPISTHTKIKVLIEKRGSFTAGMEWKTISDYALLRLSQSYPERGKHVSLKIEVISKQGSPFNGYVDALAFIWGSPTPHSKECLKKSGLEGTCFLPGDAAAISRAWEWLDRGAKLEGEDWAILLGQPEAGKQSSLVFTILKRLGEACQKDAELWQKYLASTVSHLESKAIDLRVLGRQVEWLENWSPSDQALPPLARLLWLTAKLSRANHLGETEQGWMNEMRDLAGQLIEENAHLVCRAELNLAVTATNGFNFDLATDTLKRWGELPVAVPGLRYWAQMKSSHGQHEAFRGNNREAVKLFDEALGAFARLSNKEEGRRESQQTKTYRAISLMDDPEVSENDVIAAMEQALGPDPLLQVIPKLATSLDNDDKYAHHLLLRYLVDRPNKELATAYLQQIENWSTNDGHPWPLIQLYRGFLLHDSNLEAARKLATEGYSQTTNQGPTVQLIGACCRAIASAWGAEPWQEAETQLNSIQKALPLAAERVKSVRDFLENFGNELEMLRKVLPFNFR